MAGSEKRIDGSVISECAYVMEAEPRGELALNLASRLMFGPETFIHEVFSIRLSGFCTALQSPLPISVEWYTGPLDLYQPIL